MPSRISSRPTGWTSSPPGVSTESEASAKDVATHHPADPQGEDQGRVRREHFRPAALERIAKETGARVGDRLYSDALSGPDGPAALTLK